MTQKIEKIIVKYITKSASAEDLDILLEWIQKPANKKKFKEYVSIHYSITYSMNSVTPKDTLDRLLSTIRKEKSIRYRLKRQPIIKYAAAAVVIGILSTTIFLKDNIFNNKVNTPNIVNTKIEQGTSKALLTLQDGTEVALIKGVKYLTPNAESNGEEIKYQNKEENKVATAYNYLTIPRGGLFSVKLADGTKVWLNSESQLKYPVSFLKGESRKVELVYGEAYFDVSPSTNHNGATFQVINKGQNVEVLGTEFNIKAYKDETNIYTTLVEGKVAINYNKDRKQYLVPNQQSNYNIKTNTLSIATTDVYNEISWKDGVFSFENKPLKEIMKVLSRWYDIEVNFQNKKAANTKFIGNLSKNQSINEILSTIKNFGIIKEYKIENKKVTIK